MHPQTYIQYVGNHCEKSLSCLERYYCLLTPWTYRISHQIKNISWIHIMFKYVWSLRVWGGTGLNLLSWNTWRTQNFSRKETIIQLVLFFWLLLVLVIFTGWWWLYLLGGGGDGDVYLRNWLSFFPKKNSRTIRTQPGPVCHNSILSVLFEVVPYTGELFIRHSGCL